MACISLRLLFRPNKPIQKKFSMIQVETIERDDHEISLVYIEGELTSVTADEFRKELSVLLSREVRFFVLNMEAVEFIDSTGLGSIIAITNRVRALEGDVKLAALQPAVQSLFKVVKADRYFPLHRTVDDAVRSLSARLSQPAPRIPPKEPGKPSRFRSWRWF